MTQQAYPVYNAPQTSAKPSTEIGENGHPRIVVYPFETMHDESWVPAGGGSGTGSGVKAIAYKFREDELLDEFAKYIDATYGQHYSRDKFQAAEFIYDGGHGSGFNVGNILKYAQRYGKKGTRADARKDMTKVLHYALLQLYIHDEESRRLEKERFPEK